MSYYNYNNSRSNASSHGNSNNLAKRLLPDQLHDVFRIEINRLNNKREIIKSSGLLFDSDIDNNNKINDPNLNKNTSKYSLPSVYIGEIFRFRFRITNKLNENLHNFGLLCHIEMNLKGHGSPTQLYPRPRELCPTSISSSENIIIDLEYPITLNEQSSYSLIFTITATNEDNGSSLYKEIFQFNSLPAISLNYQKQTLDENLFVEVLINNISNKPKLPFYININFKCLALFKSYNLTHHNNTKNTNNNDGSILLAENEKKNVLFQIEMKNPTSLVNLNALSVGQIEISWKSFGVSTDNDDDNNYFREGSFLSDIIQRRSLFCRKLASPLASASASASPPVGGLVSTSSSSDNIEILILKCPSSCYVHQPFVVTFHIFNLDRIGHKIWLSIDKNTSGYLLPCNISRKYLGILDTSSSIKTDMTLIAFAPGIHILTGIVIQTQDNNNTGNMKTIHYESTQYIYIDIDEEFHKKKLKEKREKELKLLQLQNKNDNDNDNDQLDDINLVKTDDNDIKDDKKDDKPVKQDDADKDIAADADADPDPDAVQKAIIDDKPVSAPVPAPVPAAAAAIHSIDDKVQKQDVDPSSLAKVAKQSKHRSSLELDADIQAVAAMQNDKDNDDDDIANISAPKTKPVIPAEKDLVPIGHIKSDEEIIKEELQQEQQKEIERKKSLDMIYKEEKQAPDYKDNDNNDNIDNIGDDDIDDDIDVDDALDVDAMEIKDEKQDVSDNVAIRDLGASNPNASAISVVSTGLVDTDDQTDVQNTIDNTTTNTIDNTQDNDNDNNNNAIDNDVVVDNDNNDNL